MWNFRLRLETDYHRQTPPGGHSTTPSFVVSSFRLLFSLVSRGCWVSRVSAIRLSAPVSNSTLHSLWEWGSGFSRRTSLGDMRVFAHFLVQRDLYAVHSRLLARCVGIKRGILKPTHTQRTRSFSVKCVQVPVLLQVSLGLPPDIIGLCRCVHDQTGQLSVRP